MAIFPIINPRIPAPRPQGRGYGCTGDENQKTRRKKRFRRISKFRLWADNQSLRQRTENPFDLLLLFRFTLALL